MLSNGWNCALEAPRHPFLYNYPIKSALMSPLSFCPEASPHSVCKVRVPSLPQFDSVKAWKQIKDCCFSQSRAETEPVRTRLTRGHLLLVVCDEAWGMLAQVYFSPPSSVFTLSLQWIIYAEHESCAQNWVYLVAFYLGLQDVYSETIWLAPFTILNKSLCLAELLIILPSYN